jgi:hypothetical protein
VVVAPAPAPGSPTVEPSETGPDSTPGSVTPTLPEGVVSASEVSGAAPDVPTQVTEPSPSISPPASREVDTEALDVPLADPAVDLAAGVAESALSTESRPTPEGYAEAEPVPPTRPSTADSPDVVSVPDESVAGVSQEAGAVEICLRLGPMDDPDAAVLLGNLPQDASIVIDAVEEYTRDGGFFVMIPPLPTRGEAEDMLRRLAAAGIDDTWLFRTGNSVNGISLGLFTREATAQRHADDLTLRGFASEVRRRQVSATGRFITLRLPADAPTPDDLAGVGQGIPVSCP